MGKGIGREEQEQEESASRVTAERSSSANA